jgi:hypothetical protein
MFADPAIMLPLRCLLSWPRRALRLFSEGRAGVVPASKASSRGTQPHSLLLAVPAVAALFAAPVARAADDAWLDRGYSDATVSGSLNQWSIVPLSGARLEGGARLDSRQELRFSTVQTGHSSYYSVTDLWPGVGRRYALDGTLGLDQPRATYRYTWLSMRELDLKVGLTSNLSQIGPGLRSGVSAPMRFGALPQMHLSGVGRLTDNWQVSLDADGVWTARGRSVDLGLRLDYSLNRSFQFFGGYRLADFVGDAEDYYGSASVNSANVGLRYRF